MTKFTVEYARTVRLKPYETLRMGATWECTAPPGIFEEAFRLVQRETEIAIKRALEELKR